MPTTFMGGREEDRRKMHLDVLGPLAEAIIRALFTEDEKAIDVLCNSFVREIGLTDRVKVQFTPKLLNARYSIRMDFETTFDGVLHTRDLHTEYVREYKPPLADDVDKGACVMRDIMVCIGIFMRQVFDEYTYKDPDEVRLYSDGVFKLGMAEA